MLITYGNISDEDLFARIQEDDHSAFHVLYKRYYALLFTHTYNILKDRELSEDVLQEIFITIWDKRKVIYIKHNISGYIYSVTRYAALKALKKSKTLSSFIVQLQVDIEFFESTIEEQIVEQELRSKIEAEISKLPRKMREVFMLSRSSGKANREIALELGLTERTVKNQVHNALKILRTKLHLLTALFV